MPRTRIAGHRGASALVRHENTVDALIRTADVGAEWAEFDVRALVDGTLVLHHDNRLAGVRVRELTFEALQRLAARRGYRVPTLEEALRTCAVHGLKADIELKVCGAEARVADLARRILGPGQYVYTSFHDQAIARLRQLDPDADAGLLLGRPPRVTVRTRLGELFPVRRLRACGATFAAPHWRLCELGVLGRLQRAGLPVWVWTVNETARLHRFFDAGVDVIITDRPDRAVAVRARHQAPTLPDEVELDVAIA
jgi:glycerophosphoryl diester phosphodiesterase